MDETSAGIDYIDTVLCNLPANFLSSLVELHSDKQWDSFKIWINDVSANFVLDGINSNFAQVLGSGTNQIIYTSSGPSDISQLSSLLSDLQLNGTIPSGITNIKIGFATWAKNLKSDTAYAYITIIGKSISAGESRIDFVLQK